MDYLADFRAEQAARKAAYEADYRARTKAHMVECFGGWSPAQLRAEAEAARNEAAQYDYEGSAIAFNLSLRAELFEEMANGK